MAALVKPARARKPRPASLPTLTERMDDAAGEMFLQSLALVRKRVKEMRTKPRRVNAPAWVSYPCTAGAEAVREESAETPGTQWFGYLLTLVELSDDFLATQPLEVPKHSWMLSISREGRTLAITKGAARTHEEARARVEACWRTEMGAGADG